ncbi:MAG: hypothetical protein ACK4UJ_07045 [Leptonema sp. (in: bacteria)]
MPSKKDKLSKKIKEEVQTNLGSKEQETYKEVIQEIQELQIEKNEKTKEKIQDKQNINKNQETMSKRDSIYNVSSDLRLEDYTEDTQKKEYGAFLKNLLIILLFLLILAGLWKLGIWLFAPKYYLSIATSEITEDNYKNFLEDKQFFLTPQQMIHIRFTWTEKISNYFSIQILKNNGQNWVEEATLGRRIPITANYIYFAGPLDPGNYKVKVFDEKKKNLIERDIEILSSETNPNP